MIQSIPCAAAVAVILALTASAPAADLSPAQVETLNGVINQLNSASQSYKLAAQTAGPGTEKPSGSKAKLAQVRLDSAKKILPGAAQSLAGLPADNEHVAAALKQHGQLAAACQALQDRLDGKGAAPPAPSEPKPAEPDTPAPSKPAPAPADAGAMKLDYKQEKLLKDARFHLNDLEGINKKLAEWAAKAAAVEDKSMIQWSDVQGIGELVAKGKTRIEYSGNALKELPGNGKGVAEEAARRSILTAQLEENGKRITPIAEYVAKIANPASYPTLQQDIRKMRDLSSMYADTGVLDRDAEHVAALMQQAPDVWKEFQAYAKTYGALSNQQSEWGKQARGAGLGFAGNYKEFAAAVQAKRKTLPGEIEGHLAEAQQAADQAVAEKKPLFFTGGVQQKMDWARDKQAMLAAIHPEGAKATAAKIGAAEAEIAKKQESLRDDIIAANRIPVDRYRHPDRQAIEAKAIAELKKTRPDAKVLKARIASENWTRKHIYWLRDGSITETDASHLQVQLIVQLDDKLAINLPFNMTMDHMKNDQITAYPFDSKDEKVSDLPPHRFFLIENVK